MSSQQRNLVEAATTAAHAETLRQRAAKLRALGTDTAQRQAFLLEMQARAIGQGRAA